MKILFTWEMGSSSIHLHHIKLLAHALRRNRPGCKLMLASTQALTPENAQGFDEVYVTSRLHFKHASEATGTLSALSQLGWTAPDLRQTAFSNWAQLYRQINPDVVIAEASPGACLSAVLEGIPVIQTSNGNYQVSQDELSLNEHFPEFQSWLWCLTGRTYAQLLSQPGIVFAPRAADVSRPGLVFHANPAQWLNAPQEPHAQVLIFDDQGEYLELPHLLAEDGISSLKTSGHSPLDLTGVAAVFGHFDPYSVSVAITAGALYLGRNPQGKHSDFAQRCISQKLAFSMPDPQTAVHLVLAQSPKGGSHREFLDTTTALSYLLPK
jgi:hypothetical protein